MKINGKITILVNQEYTKIELLDDNAMVTFAEITLTPEQLSSALSRLAHTKCEIEVHGLEYVGKKRETKKIEFLVPEELYYSRNEESEELQKIAQSKLSDGWIASSYFGSQDSFFYKDGKQYARCTIHRWV